MPSYQLTAELWRYPGKGGWHFVTLPAELADELRARHAGAHRAFGSLRVTASLGSSEGERASHTAAVVIRGPVTEDADRALESLDLLAATNAQTVLPGHGEPWPDGWRAR